MIRLATRKMVNIDKAGWGLNCKVCTFRARVLWSLLEAGKRKFTDLNDISLGFGELEDRQTSHISWLMMSGYLAVSRRLWGTLAV